MSEVDAEFMHHIIMCVNAVEVEVILTTFVCFCSYFYVRNCCATGEKISVV